MLTAAIDRFSALMSTLPEKLKVIPESEFNHTPAPGKWSKKEILGHLIDSAANNHQRFIRVQYESVPFIVYDPDQWNLLNGYSNLEKDFVIDFWTLYNQHLLGIITTIPSDKLVLECNTGDTENHTLEWLILDYLNHMEYHLKQILSYE